MPRLRLPRSARLARNSEFERVRAEGKAEHGRYMLCSVAPCGDAGAARIGIITSRRVGSAVERNRVRRRFRELVRADRSQLATGFWVVLIARARAVGATFAELRDEWRRLAKRAGLLVLDA
ncbi:MAG: ribonuclease P protein component [Chthoniobacteraceae bacterium]